jgi:hypothetical protein
MLKNKYVNTAEMDILGIAAERGHSSIIKLALEYGAQLHIEHLLRALSKKNTSMFSAVALLIESGVAMNEDIYCEDGSALYHEIFLACDRPFHIQPSLGFKRKRTINGVLFKFKNKDKIMAVILLAQETREKIPEPFARCQLLNQLIKEVASGRVKLFSVPFNFQQVALDLFCWLREDRRKLRAEAIIRGD